MSEAGGGPTAAGLEDNARLLDVFTTVVEGHHALLDEADEDRRMEGAIDLCLQAASLQVDLLADLDDLFTLPDALIPRRPLFVLEQLGCSLALLANFEPEQPLVLTHEELDELLREAPVLNWLELYATPDGREPDLSLGEPVPEWRVAEDGEVTQIVATARDALEQVADIYADAYLVRGKEDAFAVAFGIAVQLASALRASAANGLGPTSFDGAPHRLLTAIGPMVFASLIVLALELDASKPQAWPPETVLGLVQDSLATL